MKPKIVFITDAEIIRKSLLLLYFYKRESDNGLIAHAGDW